jgi:8-oxo-dGTP pyrophosphatase MutT (NUDIX family)
MGQFTIILPDTNHQLIITASVGFISPHGQPDMYAVVKNKRGWDIPGGHVEPGETPIRAFERELAEETGCVLLPDALLVAVLKSTQDPSTGIAVYRGTCTVGVFTPMYETEAAKFVTANELLNIYFGDKDLLRELMIRADIVGRSVTAWRQA